MHGHETKSVVGPCSSKLLLSANHSLMIHCTAVCALGGHWSYLLDKVIINVSAIECHKRETFKSCRACFILCGTYLCAEPCITIGTSLLEVATTFNSSSFETNRKPGQEELASGLHGTTHSCCRLRTEQYCSKRKGVRMKAWSLQGLSSACKPRRVGLLRAYLHVNGLYGWCSRLLSSNFIKRLVSIRNLHLTWDLQTRQHR